MPGLLNFQSGPLRAPFERQLDAPGDCFCSKVGRLPALHNGINDIRRQESQTARATAFNSGRSTVAAERSRSPTISRNSTPRRFSCIGNDRVIATSSASSARDFSVPAMGSLIDTPMPSQVGIDLLAGPTEILVVADETAD
jgi:hypothetical protein